MIIGRLLAGVAGLGVFAYGLAAQAQDAPSTAAQPAAAPVQQQAAQDCSGFGCLFGSRPAAPPPAAPAADPAAPPPAPPESQTAAVAPSLADDATPVPTKKIAKPVHVVTIAADGPEVARLQRLAAAMPKEKIKIVTVRRDVDRSASDFAVSTALEPGQGADTTKLFTEQMHIVAGGTIRSINDLRGKVVSFGPDKSPSQTAARKAFAELNVQVKETPLDIDNALDGLATGDVDAVVMLAPQPIDRLKTISAPGVHLISWPEGGTLPNGATSATIDASAYPRLTKPGETIRAMGVDAMLTLSAKGVKQGAAKTFLKALSQHSDALMKRGFDLLKADLDSRKGRHLASSAD